MPGDQTLTAVVRQFLEDAKVEIPKNTIPTMGFRTKGGRLQQLHRDARGGDRGYWLYVKSVAEDASDVV